MSIAPFGQYARFFAVVPRTAKKATAEAVKPAVDSQPPEQEGRKLGARKEALRGPDPGARNR